MYQYSNIRTVPFTIIDPTYSLFQNNYIDGISDNKGYNNLKKTIFNSVQTSIAGIITDVINKISNYSSFGNTNVGNITNIINNIAGKILGESNINQDGLAYYQFRINPQKMGVNRRKIMNEKYTGAGWDEDTIGEEMIQYTYSGTSGSLVPYNIINTLVEPYFRQLFSLVGIIQGTDTIASVLDRIPELSNNPKLSDAYIKFLSFEQFWKYNNNDLLIIWEDNAYVGKFSNFKYSLNEKEPFQIFWDFDLKVYPNFTYNLYTGWITEQNYNEIQRVFNKRFQVTDTTFFNKENTNKQDIIKGNPTELTYKEEEDKLWFALLGTYPYNKDKILKIRNQMKTFNTDLTYVTPRELASMYKENVDIDIFEDWVDLKLKLPGLTPNQQEEVKKEEQKVETSEEIQEVEINNG